MKKIRVAINGFGRIGRLALKVASQKKNVEVVAVNDLTDTRTLAHLLQHDTAYHAFAKKISSDANHIIVAGKKIPAFAERDPARLPWKKLQVDVVIESTGFFRDKESAGKHLKAGAKKVIISAPSKGEGIKTFVLGVNGQDYAGEQIIDNASCTTNCAAPMMLVLQKTFGVEKAMLSTVHSYTASQLLQDGPNKDLREARAAAQNMVPTATGAAVAVTRTIPALSGKFDGLAIRVPTITVSLTDLTVLLKKSVTVAAVNAAFVRAAKTYLKGVLTVSDEPLVSSDYIGNPNSSIVDLELTRVVDGNLVKVVGWYDNEWGYANRLVEMVVVMGRQS